MARNKIMGNSGGKQHYLGKSDKARNHPYNNNISNEFHVEHWNDVFRRQLLTPVDNVLIKKRV
jgi:Mor family transcriptional regulator